MIIPDYLKEPKLEGYKYGVLDFDKKADTFLLSGEPLMLEFAKRVFPGSVYSRNKAVSIKATDRAVSDLNWLLLRFPVEVTCQNDLIRKRNHVIERFNSRMTGRDLKRTTPPSKFIGKLFPFQEEAVTFLTTNKRVLLSDEMGCIDGDAILGFNRAGKGFKAKLSDAYRRFHCLNQGGPRRNWNPEIKTYARSLCGEEIHLNRVVDIIDKGWRPVVCVELKSGKSLRMTLDHEVLTSIGYVCAENLKPGDLVLTNGKSYLRLNGSRVVFVPVHDPVVSVLPDGHAHVYDVVMEDPYRNFVANGFIVHNCGKTWSALGAAASGDMYPVLIVCQSQVLRQWQRMIGALFDVGTYQVPIDGDPFSIACERGENIAPILHGRTPYDIPDTPFTVIHYGLLQDWVRPLMDRVYPTVIFDEVQELRHTGTNKYSAASKLSSNAEYVWGLSGTPIFGYGAEIWNVMNAIEFNCLGSYEAFTRDWCEGYLSKIVGNPKALNSMMIRDGLMLRRKFDDENVRISLPKVDRKIIDIDYDTEMYDKLIKKARIRAGAYDGATFTERGKIAREVENDSRLATGVAKAGFVADFVASLIEAGEKPLVYAWHHAVHDKIIESLEKYKPSVLTGKQTEAQKDLALKRFAGGETDVCLLSLRSAAGIDGLQARATCCVFAELDWSPAVFSQCESRIARIGVDKIMKNVPSYYCVSSTGFDEVMRDVLGIKVQQFVGIVGDEPESAEEQKEAEKRAEDRIKQLIKRLKA